jgi:hypothetical protein
MKASLKLLLLQLFVVWALLMTANAVLAQTGCWYNGRLYPPGTRLGPLTCMPDGRWR